MVFCSKCGNELPVEGNFCNKCGKQINASVEKPSRWWYLLPIFFTLLGGIIAYFALRNRDKKLAKDCLYVGIIIFVITFTIGIIAGMMSALFEHM